MKEPKEYAKELVEMFEYKIINHKGNDYNLIWMPSPDAKKCALMCVEVAQENTLRDNEIEEAGRKGYIIKSYRTYDYYEEVKQEIELL